MPEETIELEADVLIVGAGAAGIAAAAELSAAGTSAVMLEARDRVGGRVDTRLDVHSGLRVELGAEFVHGLADVTVEWLNVSRTCIVDADRSRRLHAGGRLIPADASFARTRRALEKLERPTLDMPFAEFLERVPRSKLPANARRQARALVEGFDAAQADRVSTFETLDTWAGPAAVDAPTFRPRDGYAAMLEGILHRVEPRHVDLRLGCIVQEIAWRRGHVRIVASCHGRRLEVTGRRAIITLPLGVLQLPPDTPGAVRFEPPLRRKRRALDGCAMGAAIKIVLSFRESFWERIDGGRHRDAAFFFAQDASFPTFWTSLPVRSSNLVAWTAGTKALQLSGLDARELLREALGSLDCIFKTQVDSAELLRASHVKNWQSDPFARGAYSYVIAGGGDARRRLGLTLDDTLFFAGEAVDTNGHAATVIGALCSGRAAASRVMRR